MKYLKKAVGILFLSIFLYLYWGIIVYFLLIGAYYLLLSLLNGHFIGWSEISVVAHMACVAISFALTLVFCISSGLEDAHNEADSECYNIKKSADIQVQIANHHAEEAMKKAEFAEKRLFVYKQSLSEKAKGFPAILSAIEDMEAFYDNEDSLSLARKQRPALKSAELVKLHSQEKREALKKARYFENIVKYYEDIFPDLVDIREQEIEAEESSYEIDHKYTERERQDESTKMLSRAEYLSLKSAERNQLALERYWKRRHSSATLGKMYERYVGYLYEKQGYEVEYFGINQKLNDLGVDLICRKGKTILAVQCKYWSKYKSVFENRIFQHFGTAFRMAKENDGHKVIPVFYATTQLSDNAREFAKMLKIKVVENHVFDKSYPCIKCNIGSNGEKVYHLPFDQLYDKVKIEPKKGEFYAKTCQEAEEKGFRRAYRWSGKKQ